jgi:tetratricopeptide (TPR) repeat protein
LALAKKGYVLAYEKKDYAKAREAVDEALKVEGLAPVARVTALQVLAQCQMKTDKNYQEAAGNLEAALKLEGVDWAKPGLTMDLGNCYRELHDDPKALATYQQLIAMANADKAMKAGAHLFCGFIYQYGLKEAENAKKSYAAAVELRPDLKKEVDGHLGRLAP